MTGIVAIMSRLLKIINGIVYLFGKIGDALGSSSSMWARLAILGGFITDLNGSTNEVHFFLHKFGLGSNFWFATGIVFVEYLRKFVRDNKMDKKLLLKVEWTFIKTDRLVYRSRVLYFQNTIMILAGLQEVLRASRSEWVPGMIIFSSGGRTIYTTMVMLISLIVISRPVSLLVQYVGRAKSRPAWYQLFAPVIFLLIHAGTFIWEFVRGGSNGEHLEWNGRYFEWKNQKLSLSLPYFLIRFKDFGFIFVWPVIHGLAMRQLSGRKAQVSKLVSIILASSALAVYIAYAQRADLVTMSVPVILGNMNIVFAAVSIGMSWIPLKLMLGGHYESDRPHLIMALLILYILAFLHGVMHNAASALKLVSQLLSRVLHIDDKMLQIDDEILQTDDELPLSNPDPSAGNFSFIQSQLEDIKSELSVILDKLENNHSLTFYSVDTGSATSTADEPINEETHESGSSTGQKQGTSSPEIKKVV